ncbi:MAG: hypothetical protein IT361_15090 [Gemmatimonadaceae bacterium]|nr:hypothetical protein [Gemmatimonadaceae bacterium]
MKRRMTVRITSLGSEDAGDPRMGGSVDERVAAVGVLTLEAWRLSGRQLPSYTRNAMPVVLATLREHNADE